MINAITVINPNGEQCRMELTRPEQSGFIVLSSDGLGPATATINTTEQVTYDGVKYNSARLASRNIVLALRYLSDDMIEDVRHLSYKYFPIKKKVTLLIETDRRSLMTEGYIETNEPNIFSDAEGTSISIICPFPYFYDYSNGGYTNVGFASYEANFEFPFSNESLTEPLIEFGIYNLISTKAIWYEGDADTGVIIRIKANGTASNITLYDITTNQQMIIYTDRFIVTDVVDALSDSDGTSILDFNDLKINAVSALGETGETLIAGDEIIISTIIGNKYATLTRNGITTSILNCLSLNSEWFQLQYGENILAYTAEVGATNLQITVTYQTLYEGV